MPAPTPGPDWTQITTAIGTLVAAGTIFFAGLQVSLSKRESQRELVAGLTEEWNGDRLVAARQAILKYRGVDVTGAEDDDAWARQLQEAFFRERAGFTDEYFLFLRDLNYFEGLGVLYSRLTKKNQQLVRDYLRSAILHHWRLWESTVKDFRDRGQSATVYQQFEALHIAMVQG